MFSENAIKVLEKRYLLRDENGEISETPEGLFRRVAKAVALAEVKFGGESAKDRERQMEERFFQAMISKKFMPNSPTLMNAGKEKGQLSACFVLPVPDSLDGIFETCKNAALIHKTGGGTGFSFSRLRPHNDRVATSCGVASGPVSFMMVYDAATEAIRQGGTRRGANMGILRVDHPDIEDFITCKHDTTRLNNFNISVAVTDAFMDAVEKNKEYDLIHPRTKKPVGKRRAREIFDKIAVNAHDTGEPGLVFIDRINAQDPVKETIGKNGQVVPGTEDIEATNPCGEQPLGPGDACNLGSINVAQFIDNEQVDFNWKELGETIELCVRFLDNVVEVNHYPLSFIEEATRNNRRIGLGLMGFAEALIMLDIPYDTEKAVKKGEKLMSFFQEKAHAASQKLAAERGTFPNYQYSTWAQKGVAMRNATVTTIAPTGTISILAGTSSGIEPIFAVSFVRRVLGGMELVDVNPLFEKMAKERGFYSPQLMEKIAHYGTLANLDEIPDDIRKVWVCSHDISYEWHVRMQVAFQKNTDNAVSKTINFPHDAPVEDVSEAYLAAWRMGLKGITVYRDTSRLSQVLNINRTDPLKAIAKIDSQKGEEEVSFPASKKDHSATLAGTVTSPRMALGQAHVDEDILSYGRTGVQARTQRDSGGHPAYISFDPCPGCGINASSFTRYQSCFMCVSCGYTKC